MAPSIENGNQPQHVSHSNRSKGLARLGLLVDDDNQLRILDAETNSNIQRLVQECNEFMQTTRRFQTLVNEFADVIDKLSESVEKSKIRAIGSRNALNSLQREKIGRKQQLLASLKSKSRELDRLKRYHDSLLKREQTLNDLIDRFSNLQV